MDRHFDKLVTDDNSVLPKSFEKRSPRFKIFQQRISERRPNYMESTWVIILTNHRFKDPSDRNAVNCLEVDSEYHSNV